MSVFTEQELHYLATQPLMRFATASLDGKPDIAPVVFEVDGDDIVTAGFDIAHTVRYRNLQKNPQATVVIDDLASMNPWSPRGIKVIGTATIETFEGGERFRISPRVIVSWAINDTTPGIPKMERREVS
ncbi:MAG: PPOX class F420-dependent oxidoreductase [Actinomycetes bacterium]|jgi:pyridoxamine 5'-phosphate oxidase family protein